MDAVTQTKLHAKADGLAYAIHYPQATGIPAADLRASMEYRGIQPGSAAAAVYSSWFSDAFYARKATVSA